MRQVKIKEVTDDFFSVSLEWNRKKEISISMNWAHNTSNQWQQNIFLFSSGSHQERKWQMGYTERMSFEPDDAKRNSHQHFVWKENSVLYVTFCQSCETKLNLNLRQANCVWEGDMW